MDGATIKTDSAKFPQIIGLLESSFPSFYSICISIIRDKVKYNVMLVSKDRFFSFLFFFLSFKITILEFKENCPQEGREAAKVWLNLQANGKQHKNVNTVLFKYLHGLKAKKNESLHFKQIISFFQ